MDIFWILLGLVLLLIGVVGAIIPGIPGPIISFSALLILQLKEDAPFSEEFMVVMGLIAATITVLDYIVPIWGTKKFGGTKKGVWGSTIGLIIGMFFITLGPFGIVGILLGPFAGAYIGESMGGQDSRTATRAAIGSFIGFLAGTMMKLVYSIIAAVYFVKEAYNYIISLF
jgi:uncharacterized protein YqgC (DUF456 family)